MKDVPSSGDSTAGSLLDARLVYETRLVLSREPTPHELSRLRAFYQETVKMPKPALVKASLSLSRESPGGKVASSEVEAFAAVSSILFNLDAALVR
jgi:hypothetical protein